MSALADLCGSLAQLFPEHPELAQVYAAATASSATASHHPTPQPQPQLPPQQQPTPPQHQQHSSASASCHENDSEEEDEDDDFEEEDEDTRHRCSQCKLELPRSRFPLRLATLQPFVVCKTHEWYWTPERRELQWAPEQDSTIELVCREVRRLAQAGQDEKIAGTWMIKGGSDDRGAVVQRISNPDLWTTMMLANRVSRASKQPAPPTPYSYKLEPVAKSNAPALRLVVTPHNAAQRIIITVRRDGGRRPGAWADTNRPSSARATLSTDGTGTTKAAPKKRKKQEPATGEPSRIGASRGWEDETTGDERALMEQQQQQQTAAQSAGAAFQALIAQSFEQSHVHQQGSDLTSDHTSLAPPTKRPRRVEPSLVFATPHSQRPDLHTVLDPSLASIDPSLPPPPVEPSFSTPADVPVTPYVAARPAPNHFVSTTSNDSATPIYSILSGLPRSASDSRSQLQPITLAELLAADWTNPPSIPLQQRVLTRPHASTTTPRTADGASQRRGRGRKTAVEELRSEAPMSMALSPEEDADVENDDEEEEEEEEEEDSSEADDEASEEDETDSEEGEGEEGDWLTGFVKDQLLATGQASQEEVDELESGAESG